MQRSPAFGRRWLGLRGFASRGPRGRWLGSRRLGLGVLATGLVCPCHALAWLAGLLLGRPLLDPAAQDGLHAVYVPLAILAGAGLLRPPWKQVRHLREPADAQQP